ncbi:two-component system response regulator YesN [Enterococcus sp. PF1-24]|uniref:response regulator transcription factor n=1 Tax=unclassified Enterococcus TaxID=2608891 RepID=UPI0024765718|nr:MULTISPECIES: helix-turn-helix domain-containing protein [unclassified Enterococcus]MDH6364094.1 two-component system response regulator YesN [Enterococcus sp. PFB1-1]MDH6401195.1 two-component system response regulator YesN [Enterococcus sp. PF1-24]
MSGILIVEDEILERDFLEMIVEEELNGQGIIWTCATGVQAVELARQHCPSVIFLDILIPEKDGLTALEEIRQFLPQAKVIILSAFSDFTCAQKAIDLNVTKYLLKPAKPRDIIAVLQQALACTEEGNKQLEIKTPETLEVQGFVKDALHFIQEHYTERLTLETVSAHVFMNPQYFSRVFKKEIGISYTDYVNNLRIKHACELLANSDYPSYRISSECGFNDPSYFNRVFFKQMKTTPKKYRMQTNVSIYS